MNKWNKRFIDLAINVSSWSKDSKLVGCVIVDDSNKVISVGYNGLPKYINDDCICTLDSSDKGRLAIHAEQNALSMVSTENYNKELTMYVTMPPCKWCALLITNSLVKIKRVVYLPVASEEFNDRYEVNESLRILSTHGIQVDKYDYSLDREEHMFYTYLFTLDKKDALTVLYRSDVNVLRKLIYNLSALNHVDVRDYQLEQFITYLDEVRSTIPDRFLNWVRQNNE